MQVDFLLIGQGIAGTWLSYFLEQENCSYLVLDNLSDRAPSRLAAGVINPVTGRRHSTTWMAEELFPFAWEHYRALGNKLGIGAIAQRNIIDFFPNPPVRLSFIQRTEEGNPYTRLLEDESGFRDTFHHEFGYGEILPVYTAHLSLIIPAWRQHLLRTSAIREESFRPPDLEITPDGIRYQDISARAILFCDGASSAENPWFRQLPFALNKGEALTLEIPDLPADHIYKKGLSLVPLPQKDQWWIGSAYSWDLDDPNPTTAFREQAEQLLRQWLKLPYRVTGHVAGVRPATVERRPFVGLHPLYPAIGLLNGLGTKGCSLAPYFAQQLVRHLLRGGPISPEADIRRFSRMLSRH